MPALTVDAQGQSTLLASVTNATTGAAVTVYSDAAMSVPVTLPATVPVTGTAYYVHSGLLGVTLTYMDGVTAYSADVNIGNGVTIAPAPSHAAHLSALSAVATTPETRMVTSCGRGVATGLLRGVASVVIQTVGDSTTVGSNAWFYHVGELIAARFPAYTVRHRAWSEGNTQYVTQADISAGTGNGGGERGIHYTAGNPFTHQYTPTITGDIDVRAKVAATDWSSGGTQIIVGQWTTTGNQRSWAFRLTSAGNLSFIGSVDGVATTTTHTSSSVVGFTDGAAGWVRCTHDVDNGAAGRTTTFYSSTDGETWTPLGTAQTTAGTTTLFAATVPLQLGSSDISDLWQNRFVGLMLWVEVRRGIDGPSVCSPIVDKWEFIEEDDTSGYSWTGAPVALLVNGGIGGTGIDDWSAGGIVDKLHQNHGADLFILNDGHNEGRPANDVFLETFDPYIDVVRAHFPGVPIGVLGQNPVNPDDYSHAAQVKRGLRYQSMARYCATEIDCEFIDTASVFDDLDVQLSGDGLHPSNAGYEIWGQAVYDQVIAPHVQR